MSTFADSIIQSQPSENAWPSLSSSTSSSTSSFWSSLLSMNYLTWAIVVLLLAFFGFNVFTYLAQGTQFLTDSVKKLVGEGASVPAQIVDVSAEGAKAVVNETAHTLDTGLTKVQDFAGKHGGSPIETPAPPMQQSTLNQALNEKPNQNEDQDYEADLANSSIQGGGKAGWCFIGDDRGFRSCAQVGVNDKCMSGEIFPSQEICMNPNLRA